MTSPKSKISDKAQLATDNYVNNMIINPTEGYNWSKAMLEAGYKQNYVKNNAKYLWDNGAVQKQIDKARADKQENSQLTINDVLNDLNWGIKQAKLHKPPDLSAIARLSELRGKYLSMFSETGNNAATGLSLNFSVKAPSKHAEPKTVKIG